MTSNFLLRVTKWWTSSAFYVFLLLLSSIYLWSVIGHWLNISLDHISLRQVFPPQICPDDHDQCHPTDRLCIRVQFHCVHSLLTPTADTRAPHLPNPPITQPHPTELDSCHFAQRALSGMVFCHFEHVPNERPVGRVNCNIPFKSRSALWV